jgi:predicted lipoprotein with Yx(FWY)xxD motif
MKRALFLLPISLAVAAAAAGCGTSTSTSTTAATTPTPKPAASRTAATTVDVRSTGLGKILVDAQGRTLYLFEKDKSPQSTCDGACASAWPPLVTQQAATVGAGATAAKLGTSKRTDGSLQATYAGHPLYLYAGDSKPGQTTGEGIDQFGAEWYVLAPSGHKVEDEGS